MTHAQPLAGIRAIDLAEVLSGMLLGRLLEDLGAEVVPVDRAEPPEASAGWAAQRARPPIDWTQVAPQLAEADILICDDPSSSKLEERGLHADALLSRFPSLVTARLSAFGMTGPLSGTPASERTLQALAGITAATGAAEDPTVTSTVDLASRTAVLSGLIVVVAGLVGRHRGSGGDYYDIAEFDGLITHLSTMLPSVALYGKPPARGGNRHGMTAPWNSYPCQDAHVMICTMGETMWARLVKAIGRPELLADPRFDTATSRVEHVEELDGVLSEWTLQRPASEVVSAMHGAQIPSAVIASPDQVRDSTAARNRRLVRGTNREPGAPLRSLIPGSPAPAVARRQGRLWAEIPPGSAPLHGLRVLELASYTAGPHATRLLAQLGADVLKVEPSHGEGARRLAQQVNSIGYLYYINNSGKRSCRLDLADPTDRSRFDQLVRDADILLTNLAVDTATASNIAAAQILAEHNIVHCAITGHGVESTDRSFDSVIQAESGILQLVGRRVGAPRRTPVSSADVLGAYLAAAATVIATYVRLRTGTGVSADVALFDAAVWATHAAWLDDSSRWQHARVIEACDGAVLVDTDTPAESPDASASVEDLLQAFAARGAPAAPLQDVASVVGHPQVTARNMIVEQRGPQATLLVTGNHLRSIRRENSSLTMAPVDQNTPTWLTEASAFSQEGHR